MSCEHRSPCFEMREERTIIVCESCRTELVGWRIEVTLPFFLLEQAAGRPVWDDAHVMWHLSQERREGEGLSPSALDRTQPSAFMPPGPHGNRSEDGCGGLMMTFDVAPP